MKNSYGIQMYSVRDMAKDDLEGAIKKCAELGYKYLEFAGFFGHSAEKVKAWMDEAGVSCCSTHTSWTELCPDVIDETIAYHKVIGNTRIIIPGADLSTKEKIDEFIKVVNAAKKRLALDGISLSYHNHSGEFEMKPWGMPTFAELWSRTEMDFEIDTYWAFNAGLDPIATLERFAERVNIIHLKDGFKGGIGKALGEGEAPVKVVWEYALKNGIDIVVESEGLSPTGIEEVGRCAAYLESLDNA